LTVARKRLWLSLAVDGLVMAALLAFHRWVLQPLLPDGFLGVLLLVVIVLGVLAVPVVTLVRSRRRKED
jgi:heme/copper-type cytochrome/quinol oxidase subunit 2